ncbi:hypothetical protein [Polaribacter sp. Z022]|uniref:hypothetical protein n=1 Tax=Polaribacter sp. Z022 TaxID=2927125 RepID=UPI0020203C3A|nr:hypothetical protein [Polaribacter sp. Z022]MCL7755062.1 hypothetical protein [Polaribacter sp. Z022]
MKKLLLAFICLMTFALSNAQSNKDIANVYVKRAKESLENLEVQLSLTHFDKAMKYMDTITSSKVARLGTIIHYELTNFAEAQSYAKQYFLLVKNKKSEEYLEFLDLFVNINEELEAQLAEEKRIEEERLRKEKELKRIDSLKTIWNNKSESLSLKVDSIYKFDKNNLALFKANNYYGIINDKGEVLLKADLYEDALSFDGFFILKNKVKEATKIYCYNASSKTGYTLPSPSDFNMLSTHYGEVMLPRGNGRLVTYPNNSYEPMVYDLNLKKNVKVANKQDLFKNLKKNDVIDKYNKDDELKVNKVWYKFGGHLGGGIHPLYINNNYKVHSFLCSIDGKMLRSTSRYQFIGAFYNNKFQAIKDNETVWVNQNGTKVGAPDNESGVYTGNTKVVKLSNGSYQLMQGEFIILGNEKLEKIAEFLRNNK